MHVGHVALTPFHTELHSCAFPAQVVSLPFSNMVCHLLPCRPLVSALGSGVTQSAEHPDVPLKAGV